MRCEVKLEKADGITITVTNDKIVQTVTMDGTAITLKVTDGTDTSTVTQKADSIAIVCKTFTLKADNITCTSNKDSTYESTETLEISSKKNMTVTSEGEFALTSSKAMSQSSSDSLTVKSTGAMALKSSDTFDAAGTNSTVKGSSKVQVSGPTIAVNADMKLDLESGGPATLKGAIANVQGNMVNLG